MLQLSFCRCKRRNDKPQPGSCAYFASKVVKAIQIYDSKKTPRKSHEIISFRVRSEGREMGPRGLAPLCRAGVALSPRGSPSSAHAESVLRKPSGAASQVGESPPSPGFSSAFSAFPPVTHACLFFCRAFSPSDGERAATVLGKWFFTALKLSLESGAPQGRALGCHPCTAGEAGSSHGSSASSRMEEEGFHLPCFPPFEDMGSAGSAASPSMFLPSDFLGCTSLAGTRGLTRSHPGEHPPWLSQAAKRGWCWGAGGTVSVNCG